MNWIHIVGAPRSGTTLMLELMRNSFTVDAYGAEERSIFRAPPVGQSVCTKNPQDVLVMSRVLPLMSELHAIVMLRDPRDTVVSVHGSDPGRYWTNVRMWREYYRAAVRLRAHPRVVMVRYEDLVRAPSDTQAAIARALPFLRPTSRFDEFHLMARPSPQSQTALGDVRPLDRASIGQWRGHKERLAGQLRIHGPITRELIELGYEPDAAWLGELDGVVSDETPSHWPEHRSLRGHVRRNAKVWAQVTKLALRRAGRRLRIPPTRFLPRPL